MSGRLLDSTHFKKLILDGTPIIDVRAPVEFDEGSLPNSVNLPIMNNEERAQVGTAYKKSGREAAMELGFNLVSGDLKKQRVRAWCEFIEKNPTAVITCFRGGLRSKISQEWVAEAGFDRPRIEGGYKAFRQFLIKEIDEFPSRHSFLVVSGATGSGKTLLLRDPSLQSHLVLDLEKIANHRGSAFGGFETPQPTQINFENHLAQSLIQLSERELNLSKPILVEDESRLVGVRAISESIFTHLRNSPVLLIEESIDVRIENTFNEYILKAGLQSWNSTMLDHSEKVFKNFKDATMRISKKLGGARAQEIHKNIEESEQEYIRTGNLELNRIWIRKLLEWYYDPMYLSSIESRKPKIQFRGTRLEILNHLSKKT